ncbi:hypothetical protein AOL_s00004g268 [Orbilia oligospora ATCC 24927]|uniref:Uncharacterized protein n=1 Tax=Arthrobotrys oligospora (strain ATCC 24927 / CBS 115.81 / DSM 1491) TaxID=756982 RepID=G1WYA8_ARTOA|nr:hypothetical protein AOL_s00004g268 [Orbilia oligospora ATCC 24927]EGX54235.1 hypothetical protein AOL_s00004g268 [Orbilia oligospora ATCC 24927]
MRSSPAGLLKLRQQKLGNLLSVALERATKFPKEHTSFEALSPMLVSLGPNCDFSVVSNAKTAISPDVARSYRVPDKASSSAEKKFGTTSRKKSPETRQKLTANSHR